MAEEQDYNRTLQKISANLTNALHTFGPASSQYQTVLGLLKECLGEIDRDRTRRWPNLDPETLSLAMGFLHLDSAAGTQE